MVLLREPGATGREQALSFARLGAVVTTNPADDADFVVTSELDLDREGLRRLAADELGLPTAPFWFAGTAAELAAIAEHAGFPLAVTPVADEADTGRSVLLRPEDVGPAWDRAVAAGHQRVMAETVVEIDDQVTLLTVRTASAAGPVVHFCEPIGHRVADDGTVSAWQPHRLAPAALDAAKSIGARIVNSLDGRGAYAVELLVRGDEVYFADVRPRPVDATLLTLRTHRLSVFRPACARGARASGRHHHGLPGCRCGGPGRRRCARRGRRQGHGAGGAGAGPRGGRKRCLAFR
ncbi:hypothetical protein AVZ31_02570 [Mycolicibacterium neoaurum]|nr:hypothetical protein AVZ31_02570 [Mycolicibacterium neoaurum]